MRKIMALIKYNIFSAILIIIMYGKHHGARLKVLILIYSAGEIKIYRESIIVKSDTIDGNYQSLIYERQRFRNYNKYKVVDFIKKHVDNSNYLRGKVVRFPHI